MGTTISFFLSPKQENQNIPRYIFIEYKVTGWEHDGYCSDVEKYSWSEVKNTETKQLENMVLTFDHFDEKTGILKENFNDLLENYVDEDNCEACKKGSMCHQYHHPNMGITYTPLKIFIKK